MTNREWLNSLSDEDMALAIVNQNIRILHDYRYKKFLEENHNENVGKEFVLKYKAIQTLLLEEWLKANKEA